jgi:hypothetical protein
LTLADSWGALRRDLGSAAAAGRPIAFWWRDDDCAEPSPGLDALLALRDELAVPVALAVIPFGAASLDPLFNRLRGVRGVTLVQHGAYHRNHSPSSRVATEIGGFRPLDEILGELRGARAALLRGSDAVAVAPVLVPPWNRIRMDVLPHLREIGFRGLSAAGPRRSRVRDDLAVANVHLDLVDWSAGERCLDETTAVETLRAQLARAVECDGGEPIGINSHHLVATDETWNLLRRLVEETTAAGARWADTADIFGSPHGDH